MKKFLYLLRGLPGSGKTTLARSLGAVYFEADMYFMEGNAYKFNPAKLKDAHAWCVSHVEISMKNSINSIGDCKIAVANTFTQEWEMQAYYDLAKKYNFDVFTIIVENRHGGENVHNVPDDKVEIMRNRFEIKL